MCRPLFVSANLSKLLLSECFAVSRMYSLKKKFIDFYLKFRIFPFSTPVNIDISEETTAHENMNIVTFEHVEIEHVKIEGEMTPT